MKADIKNTTTDQKQYALSLFFGGGVGGGQG
jgi:hypothetical protein